MRLTILILVISVAAVLAQRRPQRPESQDTESASSQPPQRSLSGRGRARFVKTPDFEKVSDDYEKAKEPKKRTETARRVAKPGHNIDRRYEVNENVDDIPDVRKYTKPSKVITENKFEAVNAPKTKLFEPVVTEPANVADLIKDFGNIQKGVEGKKDGPTKVELPQLLDTDVHSSTTEREAISSTEQESIDEAAKEIKKDGTTPTATTVTTTRKGLARARTRGQGSTTESAAQNSRTRTRGTRKPAEAAESSTSSGRAPFRAGRRRGGHEQETLRGRGPSIIENHDEQPGRARNERRVLTSRRKEQDTASSSTTTTSTENSRAARIDSARRTRTRRPENPTVESHKDTERGTRRRSFVQVEEATTKKEETRVRSQVGRGRMKSRFNPSEDNVKSETIAEEYKPRTQTRSRGRTRAITTEELVASSTVENPMRSVPDSSTSRTATISRRTQAHPESANRIRTETKQRVKETVMSEVSQVVSTRKVTRRKKVESTTKPITTTTREPATTTTRQPVTTVTRKPHVSVKVDEPRITVSQVITRGSKKSEVKLEKNNKNHEEDNLDELNYPPQFKALILAKNKPNGKKVEDSENELVPKTTRLPRRRFSVSTKPPHKKEVITTRKAKPTLPPRKTVIRSTTFAPEVTTQQSTTAKLKFHARFSLVDATKGPEVEKATAKPVLKRNYPGKPSRVPYTRKPAKSLEERKVTRGGKGFESAAIPAQVVSLSSAKKQNRYSSRYRSESRLGNPLRSSTVVPAYVPTIPTVTPSNQDVAWSETEPYNWFLNKVT